MTSQINPNNINGAYPVAGQDNNSQGFRDNFTNTATNFQYAAQEITELQTNAVLKAPLSGTTLNNDMLGSIISNAQIQGFTGTVVNLGTLSGVVGINFLSGPFQTVVTNGSISLAFSNWPTAGTIGEVTVQITVSSTAHTVTLPTSANINSFGIQGYDPSTGIITFATAGTYSFTFATANGGYSVIVNEFNQALSPFNGATEMLVNGSVATIGIGASYFTPTGNWGASMAAGVNGSTKVFGMIGSAGVMAITVANPAWSSALSGTITFSTAGAACTLQYFNNHWFCIGNNNAIFT